MRPDTVHNSAPNLRHCRCMRGLSLPCNCMLEVNAVRCLCAERDEHVGAQVGKGQWTRVLDMVSRIRGLGMEVGSSFTWLVSTHCKTIPHSYMVRERVRST